MSNRDRRHFDTILREPLTRQRLSLNTKIRAAQQGGDKAEPFTFADLTAFLNGLQTRGRSVDPALTAEIANALAAVQTGEAAKSPKFETPETQLVWGAALGYLLLNPDQMQGWKTPVPAGELRSSALWKDIVNTKRAHQELLTHAHHVREALRDKSTKYGWSDPGTGFTFQRQKNIINIDLMQSLIVGFEHARADVYREVGQSLLSVAYPQRMQQVYTELVPLRKKMQAAQGKPQSGKKTAKGKGPKLSDDEFKKLRLLSAEWQLRHMLFAAAEENVTSRFVASMGKQMLQDYSVSMNNTGVTFRGLGLTRLPPKGEASDALRRYMNLCNTVQLSFYQNNALFDNTNDGWHRVGVEPNLVRKLDTLARRPANAKDDKDGITHPDFIALRELCGGPDGLENLQPRQQERLFGWSNLKNRIARSSADRIAVMEKIWALYAEDLIQEILNNLEDQLDEELEQAKQNQQDQDGDDQDQDQDQDGQDGDDGQDGQEQDGDGQPGQKGQKGKKDKKDQKDKKKQKQKNKPQGDQVDPDDLDDDADGDDQDGQKQKGKKDQKDKKDKQDQKGEKGDQDQDDQDGQDKDGQDGNDADDGQYQDGEGDNSRDAELGRDKDNKVPVEGAGEMDAPSDDAFEDPADEQDPDAGQDADGQDGDDADGEGNDADGQDGDDADGDGDDANMTQEEIEKALKEAEAEENGESADADGEGDDADGPGKKSKSKKPGGKKAGKEDGRKLADLAQQDWTKYQERINELAPQITRVRKMFKDVQERQLQRKRVKAPKLDIIPENGEVLDRFNQEAHRNLTLKKATGQVTPDDLNRFHVDQVEMTPTQIDIVLMIDGSGSMTSNRVGGVTVLDCALQASAIMYEAAAGKDMNINVYVCMWGDSNPPILIKPGDDRVKVGQAMQSARSGLQSGTNFTPAVKKVAEIIAEDRGKSGVMSGFTHVLILSDGDSSDPVPSVDAIQTVFTYSDKVTFDVAVISNNADTAMKRMAKSVKGHKTFQDVGVALGRDPNTIPLEIVGLLLDKVRKCGSFQAVPTAQKRRQMQKAYSKLDKKK